MGCLFRTGCFIVLLCVAVVAWFTRDRWMSRIAGTPPVVARGPVWEPLTPEAGERGRAYASEGRHRVARGPRPAR